MILIDLNQVMISNLMVQIGNHHNIDLDENLIRHMVLNSLRSYRTKFKDEYGELVICCDDKNYWRRGLFPYYKASRRKSREESELNWNEIFRILNMIRDEIKNYFPYKVLQIESAEADDIIATLCHTYGNQLNVGEQILIMSADKDYIQLHVYANVKQYDPIRRRWIRHDDPNMYLKEHVLKGDTGDGVPNVLSPDDCFVMGKRQKPLTKKRIEQLVNGNVSDTEILRGIKRNEMLIDLSKIPDHIKKQVLDKYDYDEGIGRKHLFNYFINNRLKNLLENINEF
jgi:hypothetical protein